MSAISQAAADQSIDFVGKPRFRIQVDAAGAFRPNTPVTVLVTVSGATKATADAEIAMFLPEVQAYDADRANYRGVPVGMKLRPTHSWNLAVARNASVTRSAVITFPEPGLYTLQVVARATTPDPDMDWTNDSETANVWINIDNAGGRLARDYDPSMLQTDALATGPRRAITPAVSQNFCETNCPPRPCCFGGTLTFADPVTQTTQPMRDVTVQVNYPNGESFSTIAGLTGAFGGLPCPKTGETGWIYFQTYSSAFSVTYFGASGWQFAPYRQPSATRVA